MKPLLQMQQSRTGVSGQPFCASAAPAGGQLDDALAACSSSSNDSTVTLS
eukprot:CAMPEP_0197870914 /NCGR_PEP_ID=MMETSP1439-20131203/1455_1 /TAXON_ID=66791 /ORGANISM="Gonyaulax spinifera, Strain CCMP409" /LENGTH=49 /DNA_ID= /DNA_START= /DNA_END= /DNA_ORIENTATION=